MDNPAYRPPAPPPPAWAPPEKIDIGRLPVTGAELFGRDRELALLDDAWKSGATHVVSLVGWGGVGKSTLVNKWLERLGADNYRGARRVFGWSFYSQGTGERVTSADQFISQALRWFGDPDPAAGSPWDKGERLAALVRAQKTLLILDGLEPLQSDMALERGKVKDPGLAVLLAELARDNPGLCVITTRELVADLAPFAATARQENLEHLSPAAGRALLRIGGVQGTDAELEAVSAAFGNHALAVTLLTSYLQALPGHPASSAGEIPDLDAPEEKGKHPRRVMAAFAARFGAGPEVELLQVLGLFDRPAELAAIKAVRKTPAIPGLTEHIGKMDAAAWLRLLEDLRRVKLIAAADRHQAEVLDAHPLVREHFGEQLKQANAAAWREAHSRLYEYYKKQAPDQPDTLEAMAPLYAAVAHGCAAGRHQEALVEVYWRRIRRDTDAYSITKLGAFGADLAALAGFFDPPWCQPVVGLREGSKALVLTEAGFDLRAWAGWRRRGSRCSVAGHSYRKQRLEERCHSCRQPQRAQPGRRRPDRGAPHRRTERRAGRPQRRLGDAHDESHDPGRRVPPGRTNGRGRGPLPRGGGAAGGAAAGVAAPLLAPGLPVLRPAVGAGAGGGGAAPGRADFEVGGAIWFELARLSPSTTSPWAGRT